MDKENNDLRKEINVQRPDIYDFYNTNSDNYNTFCNNLIDKERAVLVRDNNSNTYQLQSRKTPNKILLMGHDNVKRLIRLLKININYSYDINSYRLNNYSPDELVQHLLKVQ